MSKQILLINDLPGYGNVALAAMIPVLSRMGHQIYNLPTALVSNTLDYGKFYVQETTVYMKETIKVWDELGFHFDAIATGFIVSDEQADLITSYSRDEKKHGTQIFVDPIMGDEGHLYNGLDNTRVEIMRRLVSSADYIVPNMTEATLLTGTPWKKEGYTSEETKEIIKKLHTMGAHSIVITSAIIDGEDSVMAYDEKEDHYFKIPFNKIPVRFPGTGDIFMSFFMGDILDGKDMETTTKDAMDRVRNLIWKYKDEDDKYKGLPIELL